MTHLLKIAEGVEVAPLLAQLETHPELPPDAQALRQTLPEPAVTRGKILALEAEVAKLAQVEMPLRHFFANGVYARELTIPAGTVVVGKIHKYAQINILSKGDISIATEQGVRRVQAPHTVVSPPGTKRVGYAHTETVWTTISRTDETDLELIEKELIAESFENYELFCREAMRLKGTS